MKNFFFQWLWRAEKMGEKRNSPKTRSQFIISGDLKKVFPFLAVKYIFYRLWFTTKTAFDKQHLTAKKERRRDSFTFICL